ncbi:MAG TPA: hypothetical protein VG270_10185 [Pseudolabrys sp.]|jgi:hypothetical protein|nr:hypothetical protein [Pseudolabrys sp.]
MRLYQFAAAAALVTFTCGAAQASDFSLTDTDSTAMGIGMICNTPDQAEQFLALREHGAAAKDAMLKVNQQAKDPHACGVAAIAFTRDKTVDAKPVANKLVQIVRINVLAGFNGNGWQRVPGMTQYAVMEGEGESI